LENYHPSLADFMNGKRVSAVFHYRFSDCISFA